MRFRQWLDIQEDTGLVHHRSLNNVEAGDGFEYIRSKYMAGQKKQPPKTFDPDEKFGKKKRRMKSK
jgi:hypothetical protein